MLTCSLQVMGLMSKRSWSELSPEDVVPAPPTARKHDLWSAFPYLEAHDNDFGQMRW